jgi:DNA-binding protein
MLQETIDKQADDFLIEALGQRPAQEQEVDNGMVNDEPLPETEVPVQSLEQPIQEVETQEAPTDGREETQEIGLIELEDEEAFDSKPVANTVDLSKLREAFDVQEDSVEAIVNKGLELKAKLLEVESRKPSFANDQIALANELAAYGGDWKTALGVSSINYDIIPDIDLVEFKIASEFPDTDEGRMSMDSYIDSLTDHQIEVQATLARKELKQKQEADIKSQHAFLENKRKEISNGIINSAERLKSIEGVKVPRSFFEGLSADDIVPFANLAGYQTPQGVDYQKIVRDIFVTRYFSKVVEVLKTQTRNQERRDIVSNMSNIEINKTTQKEQPKGEQLSPLSAHIEKMLATSGSQFGL